MSKPKTGSVQKIDTSKWRVWFYVGGKRRSRICRGTKADAYALLHDLSNQTDQPNPSSILTFDTIWDEYYHPYIIRMRAPRTVEGYESQWKRARPLFGDDDMRNITAATIESRIQTLETPGQQQAAFKIMRQICTFAYNRSLIDTNPMRRKIERKRMPHFERVVYNAQEAREVLDLVHTESYEFEILIYLCMLAGMRRSEALALLWEDVTFTDQGAVCHINKTWQRKRGTLGAEQDTKTAKSKRSVVIPAPYADYMKAKQSKPKAGVVSEPRPNPDRTTRSWRRFCESQRIKYVSIQGLRATYSSLLSETGATDAVISDSLGHSTLQTRYKHYLYRSDDARAALAADLTAHLLHTKTDE